MPKGAIERFELKKVLFNICCQDEVFLPDILVHKNVRKKV